MNRRTLGRALITVMLVFISVAGLAQEGKKVLPTVASIAVPIYPQLARTARIEGVVHIKVTTDGHRVIATSFEKGSAHPLLAQAAQDNVRTWQFAVHDPTTFTVTYRYKLSVDLKAEQNPTVTLRLPTEIEINALPWREILTPFSIK